MLTIFSTSHDQSWEEYGTKEYSFAILASEKTYLYISALKKPGRFELWTPVTGEFKYMQVRRRPQVFFLCIEDFSKFMLFLAFPFAFKLVYKRKVRCASKADTVHNPHQSWSLYIARFIWHVQFTAVLLFGNNGSTSSAFVRKLSQVNEKPMIVIIISVCSEMITYKTVKANSWLRYWLLT